TQLDGVLADSEIGKIGVAELREVISGVKNLGLRAELDLDVSLARGLNYYTGTIIEVKALDTQIGSITGGGRYDNLTGVFGLPGVSGVGISFGADRIYDVMNTLNLYPEDTLRNSKVMFTSFGKEEAAAALSMLMQMRRAGIPSEIFPDVTKMQKQMKYADAMAIPFVAIIGESEMSQNKLTLKNMTTGEQQLMSIDEAIGYLKNA
ncbi:MAG: His/Gly/Thr/Pro-type tRNA ligase C-terminal domain-containing protein, partial [Muribaculaceae bacterium]|nr:His/Gly/Thr/Pro-type tRNA ligase C-terminal domain-containing protein [Muribaculaceae bacterium]